MSTHLTVDWTRCDGRGLCIELVPELLVEDDWGYPEARDGDPTLPVHPRVLRHAQDAVRECPRLALRLTER
jgi:ferredoxin